MSKWTHTLAQAAGRLNIPGLSISPRLRFTLIFNITMTCQKLILREHYSQPLRQCKYAAEQVIAGAVSRYSATRFILCVPWFVWPCDQVIVPRLMQQLQQGGGCFTFAAARGRRVIDLTFVQNVVYAMRLATNVEGLAARAVFTTSANHQPQQLSVMLDALLHQQLGLSYRIAVVPGLLLSLIARGLEL
ncbi:hypothetical protein MJ570_06340 [Escherichia coli]|nr:hypothetical protein MJ570_06340 [Escherichia coli]